jgi:signal transduction histidine kinase
MIAYLIFSSFLIALLTLFFFFAVLVKGIRSGGGRNLAFCLFSFSIFVWSTGHMFWLLSETEAQALYWVKVLVFGSIFVPYTYFHFVVNITDRYALRKFVYISYGLAVCLALLNLGPFVVVRLEPRLGFPYWPVPGVGFPAYLGSFCSLVILGACLLFEKYRTAAIEAKNQYKYILLGTGIGFAGGSTNFLLWMDIPIPPFGHLLVLVYILGLGYSMLKYRILDFSEMVFRVLGMLLVAILFSGVTAQGLVYLLSTVYPEFFPSGFFFWWAICLLISIVIVSFGSPVSIFFSEMLHERFLSNRYAYRTELKMLSERVALAAGTKESISEIARELMDVLSVDSVGVYIRSEIDFDYVSSGSAGERDWAKRVPASELSFMLDRLSGQPKAIVLAELMHNSRSFEAELGHACGDGKLLQSTDILVPISGFSELLGVLVLGKRRFRAVYADVDFLLIENLCSQLGLAIKFREFERMSNQAEKLISLGTMAAGLSHELRNPLVSIRTLASLLEKNPENLSLNRSFSATVQRDVKRISGIVEGVAAFAQDAERPTMPVVIKQVILEAKSALEYRLVPERVEIKLLVQKNVPAALGDSEQLIQVFQNVLENAINAITEWDDRPEQGRINVNVDLRGGRKYKRWVDVEISDNGPGMPVEFQSRVFDPFVTSRDTGIRSGAKGTGLGLAIVTKIIEHHRGVITVDSQVGKGAHFRISIPCA